MSEFKVGDLVRIIDCGLSQPKHMLGKTYPIVSVSPTGTIVYVVNNEDKYDWAFVLREIEHVELKPLLSKEKMYMFRFGMPDGTSGTVDVHVRGNTTQVTIIVEPAQRYCACNRGKQFFGGLAFCNPKDKFDVTIGIKEACKNALRVTHLYSWDGGEDSDYRRAIYSSIRKAMRGTNDRHN